MTFPSGLHTGGKTIPFPCPPRSTPASHGGLCNVPLETRYCSLHNTCVFSLFYFSIINESLQKQEEELKRVSASLFLDVFSLLPDDDDHRRRRRRRRRHSTASFSITLNVQTLTFSTP
jgi:hypothetical protein